MTVIKRGCSITLEQAQGSLRVESRRSRQYLLYVQDYYIFCSGVWWLFRFLKLFQQSLDCTRNVLPWREVCGKKACLWSIPHAQGLATLGAPRGKCPLYPANRLGLFWPRVWWGIAALSSFPSDPCQRQRRGSVSGLSAFSTCSEGLLAEVQKMNFVWNIIQFYMFTWHHQILSEG